MDLWGMRQLRIFDPMTRYGGGPSGLVNNIREDDHLHIVERNSWHRELDSELCIYKVELHNFHNSNFGMIYINYVDQHELH